jgi:hypothetical protein
LNREISLLINSNSILRLSNSVNTVLVFLFQVLNILNIGSPCIKLFLLQILIIDLVDIIAHVLLQHPVFLLFLEPLHRHLNHFFEHAVDMLSLRYGVFWIANELLYSFLANHLEPLSVSFNKLLSHLFTLYFVVVTSYLVMGLFG